MTATFCPPELTSYLSSRHTYPMRPSLPPARRGIACVRNKLTDARYFLHSMDLRNSFDVWVKRLFAGEGPSLLQTDFDKFGPEQFEFVVLQLGGHSDKFQPKVEKMMSDALACYNTSERIGPRLCLTFDQVLSIYNDTRQVKNIAEEYHCSSTLVTLIKKQERYTWVFHEAKKKGLL